MSIRRANMYKNKADDGSNNLCGRKVKLFRERMATHPSQKEFSDMLQIEGLDVDKMLYKELKAVNDLLPTLS